MKKYLVNSKKKKKSNIIKEYSNQLYVIRLHGDKHDAYNTIYFPLY